MRYAMIMAGGSGTRLWPMSRSGLPKQLIPFLEGRSLLQVALDRLRGLVPVEQQYICAGQAHRELILKNIRGSAAERFYGEPMGRDTLNAIGLVAAELSVRDPEAVLAVFTADHVIQPVARFQQFVAAGFEVVERTPNALVTFGITPTYAATGYGYLELGEPQGERAKGQGIREEEVKSQKSKVESPEASNLKPQTSNLSFPQASNLKPQTSNLSLQAFLVRQYKEKPDRPTAEQYLAAGPQRYLWNSGMFVWRVSTLLDCIRRYAPRNYEGLMQLAHAWGSPQCPDLLAKVYPQLPKISVDYAVMEPASKDPAVRVVAVPMPLDWLDIGSWPSFAAVCSKDAQGNATAPASLPTVLIDSRNNLLASSDPRHVITAIGCENLIIIHTPDATLVCRADRAEDIKTLHKLVGEKFGDKLL